MKMAVRRKNKNVVVDAFGEAPPAGIEKLEAAKRDTLSAQEVSDLLPPFVSALYRAWGTRPTACIESSISERGHHEDVERTLRHIERDGRVLRMSFATLVSKYCGNSGGMQATYTTPKDRSADARRITQLLAQRFSQLGRVDPDDSSKFNFLPKGPKPLKLADLRHTMSF